MAEKNVSTEFIESLQFIFTLNEVGPKWNEQYIHFWVTGEHLAMWYLQVKICKMPQTWFGCVSEDCVRLSKFIGQHINKVGQNEPHRVHLNIWFEMNKWKSIVKRFQVLSVDRKYTKSIKCNFTEF